MNESELIQALVATGGWSKQQVELGIAADFRCEYCGKQFLSDIQSYDTWEIDHIVPSGGDNQSNLALACRLCNKMKRDWRLPNDLDQADRAKRIEAVKAVLEGRRALKQERFNRARVSIDAYRLKTAGAAV